MSEEQNLRRAALVTGGGRGIGRAICLALAKAGFDVCVNYASSSAAAEQTAADCRALGVQAVTQQADVTDPAQCQSLVEGRPRPSAGWTCWSTTPASQPTS